jgi:hypothetical protein
MYEVNKVRGIHEIKIKIFYFPCTIFSFPHKFFARLTLSIKKEKSKSI